MDAPRIITDRFLLRPLHPDDASTRYSSWFEEAQAAQYIVSARQPHDIPALRAYIQARMGRDDVLFLGIFLRDAGAEHIGNVKFEPIDERAGYAVMGILIGDAAWRGKGVTTEVLEAAITWLVTHREIKEIILGVERDHAAAIQAYQKAGFEIRETRRITVDPRSQLSMVRSVRPAS